MSFQPFVSPVTKLFEDDAKTTYRPSALIEGSLLAKFPGTPLLDTETRVVSAAKEKIGIKSIIANTIARHGIRLLRLQSCKRLFLGLIIQHLMFCVIVRKHEITQIPIDPNEKYAPV